MKRLLIAVLGICLGLILVAWWPSPAQAEQINNELEEKIMASDNGDGKLEVMWKGKPGPEGAIVLPQPALKGRWVQTEVTGAAIEDPKPKEVKYGGNKWYQWNVKGSSESKEVTLKIAYLVPELFKETKSDTTNVEGGPTNRGDLRNFSYNFKNNTPYGIGKYTCSVILPPGCEVFAVTSPKKDFRVVRDNNSGGIIVELPGKKDTAAIPTGSSVGVELSYVKGLTSAQTGVSWLASVLIAGALLYFRRHLVL
ncbi:hypothetical protein SAMN00808754_2371 [Thermanaeromonas toyohensis ToBE]|uniref:Uncharacterized protein n=1 Tax=Thermanaeromonas toyohensis ToBE TaxID=698762 RepID=A0A1W1VYQ7_9FIRM|nr:hypothetical protein [Thermanaeromonas toyohensis]SMB98497.1 hypothetical protein SAMN00808754_2371 [Thermanaeromonas toyohensis ToBE]